MEKKTAEAKELLLQKHYVMNKGFLNDPGYIYSAMEEYSTQQNSELVKENEELREALQRIVNPIKFLQIEAEKEGNQLDGMMAVALSENPSYLRIIAREALNIKD